MIGPSGSGKSTLMHALCASIPADEGDVRLNGASLYASFASLKADIALVPQRELLFEGLPLGEALRYTARLRLPADSTPAEIEARVTGILASVGLAEHGETLIANLSGGQRKRASLANETLCDPSLLFLDEVTSGLDEGTDWEMMRLFRSLADAGNTVVCVTHSLANVEECCHKIAVMAPPGVLAFHGTPMQARHYFQVRRLGEIFRRLPERPTQEWRQRAGTAPPGAAATPASPRPARRVMPALGVAWAEAGRQAPVLLRRHARVLLQDRRTLQVGMLQSALIGLLLVFVFGRLPQPHPLEYTLLFLMGISAFWLGCNHAAKEIGKEWPMYRRERASGVSPLAYLGAKTAVSAALALTQVSLMFALVVVLGRLPGDPLLQWIQLESAALGGTALGLLISAVAGSRDQANTLVPLALIPQIVLAGVIIDPLPAAAEWVARLGVSNYWVYEGMTAVLHQTDSRAWIALTVVLAHVAVLLGLTWGVLARRDRPPG